MLPHPLDGPGHEIASTNEKKKEGTVCQFQAEVLRRPGKSPMVFSEFLPSTMRKNVLDSH